MCPREDEHIATADAGGGASRTADPKVLVSESSPIPVYLQIAHQLTYLIYSRGLEEGDRLPTVREMAKRLAVHSNTVSQAYAELKRAGLIDTFRGRGTFVSPLGIDRDADWAQRLQLLHSEVERMRRRVHALGFTDEDIASQVSASSQLSTETCRVLFVAPNRGAHKYADLLTAELEPYAVEVAPLEYEWLLERTAQAEAALQDVYFLLTPVSIRQQVEELLAWHETKHRVLGITLEITEETARNVAGLGSDHRLCVFTSERYLAIVLNILHTYGTAPHASIARVLDTTPAEKVQAAFAASDVIVHTYGVGPLLDELDVPHDKRLPLEFLPDEDSVARLRDLFAHRTPRSHDLRA